MKTTLCGTDCHHCGLHALCNGCAATCSKPFGQPCFVAAYIQSGGTEAFEAFKQQLVMEVNALKIPGMPPAAELMPVNGRFVNMAYRLPNGLRITLLEDDAVYLSCQLPSQFDENSFFSVTAGMDFLLVSLRGSDGQESELLAYRQR